MSHPSTAPPLLAFWFNRVNTSLYRGANLITRASGSSISKPSSVEIVSTTRTIEISFMEGSTLILIPFESSESDSSLSRKTSYVVLANSASASSAATSQGPRRTGIDPQI